MDGDLMDGAHCFLWMENGDFRTGRGNIPLGYLEYKDLCLHSPYICPRFRTFKRSHRYLHEGVEVTFCHRNFIYWSYSKCPNPTPEMSKVILT